MVPSRQRGASMWVVILIALMATFYILLTIKLFPVFMGSMKVKSALQTLSKRPGVTEWTKGQIYESLYKQFVIDDLDREIDLRTALKVTVEKNHRYVRISYETVTPIIANFSVLGEFEHEVGVGRGGPQ